MHKILSKSITQSEINEHPQYVEKMKSHEKLGHCVCIYDLDITKREAADYLRSLFDEDGRMLFDMWVEEKVSASPRRARRSIKILGMKIVERLNKQFERRRVSCYADLHERQFIRVIHLKETLYPYKSIFRKIGEYALAIIAVVAFRHLIIKIISLFVK